MAAHTDFPASLSPSRSNDFLTCPLRYRYRTIDQLPEPRQAAAIRGTLVHRVLEELFAHDAADRTLELACDLLDRYFTDLQADDAEAAMILDQARVTAQSCRQYVDHYFALERPSHIEAAHREFGIAAELADGFTIRGFIDRVDRSPAGLIRIVDYKTGRSPRPGFESDALFQMRFYALAWWRATGELPAMLQLLYLGSRDLVRHEPTQHELQGTERKIFAIRDAITRSAQAGAFTATPSKLCQWCSFQAICPAFGNEPLPLPDPSTWTSGSITDAEQSTMLRVNEA